MGQCASIGGLAEVGVTVQARRHAHAAALLSGTNTAMGWAAIWLGPPVCATTASRMRRPCFLIAPVITALAHLSG